MTDSNREERHSLAEFEELEREIDGDGEAEEVNIDEDDAEIIAQASRENFARSRDPGALNANSPFNDAPAEEEPDADNEDELLELMEQKHSAAGSRQTASRGINGQTPFGNAAAMIAADLRHSAGVEQQAAYEDADGDEEENYQEAPEDQQQTDPDAVINPDDGLNLPDREQLMAMEQSEVEAEADEVVVEEVPVDERYEEDFEEDELQPEDEADVRDPMNYALDPIQLHDKVRRAHI